MTKHGNPTGGTASFPLGVEKQYLVVDKNADNPDILGVCLFGVGIQCCQTVKAAIKDFGDAGFDVRDYAAVILATEAELHKLNATHVGSMMLRWQKEHP